MAMYHSVNSPTHATMTERKASTARVDRMREAIAADRRTPEVGVMRANVQTRAYGARVGESALTLIVLACNSFARSGYCGPSGRGCCRGLVTAQWGDAWTHRRKPGIESRRPTRRPLRSKAAST